MKSYEATEMAFKNGYAKGYEDGKRDAVVVKYGRWIDEYPYVRCSECNAEWVNCITDNDPKMFKYCPNCGAKMDGE